MGWFSNLFGCQRKRNKRHRTGQQRPPITYISNPLQRRNIIPKRKKQTVNILTYLQHPIGSTAIRFTPVEIHEPLSVLQKLAEPFEYSYLLDRAAGTDNCAEQLKYVAAFSHVFATKIRERKGRPFEPLLGETFELDRSLDMGFRFLSELVCLDPLIAVAHCIGIGWTCSYSFEYVANVSSKCLDFLPNIGITITFANGNQYSWPLKLNYKVYNIIFGESYFDTFGTVEIIEKKLPEKYSCKMEYITKWPEKNENADNVVGTITSGNRSLVNIRGKWKTGLEAHDLYISSESTDWEKLWEYYPVPKDKKNSYYFTQFVIQLNEIEEYTAPTDSRWRPDIRDLENGKIKSGNTNKRSAVKNPFLYLVEFLFYTEPVQNILKSRFGKSKLIDINTDESVHDAMGRQSSEWQQPKSYSLIDILSTLPSQDQQIFIPVELHEPLTMLQKLTEIFEFSPLLDLAASSEDGGEQLTYLAAFSNVCYSTINERTTKPFTPLLGETYEYDRSRDLGWRCLSEQVQYLPPISVVHCEGRGWICTQEFSYDVIIRPQDISVLLKGWVKVHFPESNRVYRWERNKIKLYNYVMGKLVPEIQGTTHIVGSRNAKGLICALRYNRRSKIIDEHTPDMEGIIVNKSEPIIAIRYSWHEGIKASPIKSVRDSVFNIPYVAFDFRLIYRKKPIPPSREIFYNFSEFASNLNEEDGTVAPTDSRYRHDVRSLEKGIIDGSNEMKKSLEDKQQRRISSNWNKPKTETYTPTWFVRNQNGEWDYNGEYWYCKEFQDWSRCPEIF